MKIRCLVCSTLYLIPTSANLSLISKRFHSALYIIIFFLYLRLFFFVIIGNLKQITTTTTARMWQNKRSNGQNNSVSNFCTFLFRPLLNNNVISRKNLRDMSMETTMTTYHKEAIRAII